MIGNLSRGVVKEGAVQNVAVNIGTPERYDLSAASGGQARHSPLYIQVLLGKCELILSQKLEVVSFLQKCSLNVETLLARVLRNNQVSCLRGSVT